MRHKLLSVLFIIFILINLSSLIYSEGNSIRITGDFPDNTSIVLKDSLGTILDRAPLIDNETYTFNEDTYSTNNNNPFSLYIEKNSSKHYFITNIFAKNSQKPCPEFQNIIFKHISGSIKFHPDMGKDARKRYVFFKKINSKTIQLIPVKADNTFDFCMIRFDNPDSLQLYALYDVDNNKKADFSIDIISYVSSVDLSKNKIEINETVHKFKGAIDPNIYTIRDDEQLFIKINPTFSKGNKPKHTIAPINNNGEFEIFLPHPDISNLSLYKGIREFDQDKSISEFECLGKLNSLINTSTQNEDLTYFDIEKVLPQRYLVLYDLNDADSINIMNNLEQASFYSKFKYDTLDINEYNNKHIELDQYTSVGIATYKVNVLNDLSITNLSNYVFNGGGLVFLMRGWQPKLHFLMGVEDGGSDHYIEEDYFTGEDTNDSIDFGSHFVSNFYPEIKDIKIEEYVSSIDYTLKEEAEILMKGIRYEEPILWRYNYGKGKILYWNNTLLGGFFYRGMIIQSFLDVQKIGIQPIVRASTFIIDDYPSSFYENYSKPIIDEFHSNMNEIEFYTTIWEKDMLSLSDKYGFKYTFAIPFNYTFTITPPWDFNAWENAKDEKNNPLGQKIGQELQDKGHELALHGYNHVSLALDAMFEGEPMWQSQEDMIGALEAVKKQWISDFISLPVSYVPPHNHYDQTGLNALNTVFPSISNLAGALDTTHNKESFDYGFRCDFCCEPWNDAFITVPRYTFGYFDTPAKRWAIISEISLLGMWTHYVHPDDIIDTLENSPTAQPSWLRNPDGLYWRQDTEKGISLFNQLNNLLEWETTTYPWLNWKLLKDLNKIIPNFGKLELDVNYKKVNNNIVSIQINSNSNDTNFFVRIEKIKTQTLFNPKFINLEKIFENEYDDYYLYILKLTDFSGEIIIN